MQAAVGNQRHVGLVPQQQVGHFLSTGGLMKTFKRHLERTYHALRSAALYAALCAACALFAVVDVP